VRLFPVILVPACVGLLALGLGSAPWIAFVYLILAGVSQGIALHFTPNCLVRGVI
jgi:hypothetical protein